MNITLKSSDGHTFTVSRGWENANAAARAVFKRRYYSDLHYLIIFDDGDGIEGVIDLEPYDFHARHQREIVTTHLRTFWGNIAKIKPPHWGFTAADVERCKKLLTYLPPAK